MMGMEGDFQWDSGFWNQYYCLTVQITEHFILVCISVFFLSFCLSIHLSFCLSFHVNLHVLIFNPFLVDTGLCNKSFSILLCCLPTNLFHYPSCLILVHIFPNFLQLLCTCFSVFTFFLGSFSYEFDLNIENMFFMKSCANIHSVNGLGSNSIYSFNKVHWYYAHVSIFFALELCILYFDLQFFKLLKANFHPVNKGRGC